MHAPRNIFSISFLTQFSENFRLFVVGSIIGIYGLVLYEIVPALILDIQSSINYFVLPAFFVVGIGIGLPRLLKKTAPLPTKTTPESPNVFEEIVTNGTAQQILEPPIQGETVIDGTDYAVGQTNDSERTSPELNQVSVDEDLIQELIDNKFQPVEKDISAFKKDLNKIKDDMKITKDNVTILTESFEGSLTDMKAFQAEIANPLNFMRKYFESIDLKSLTDISLPLQNQMSSNSSKIINNQEQQTSNLPDTVPLKSQSNEQTPHVPKSSAPKKISEMEKIEKGTDLEDPMESVMKPLFKGSLSVGNMMSIIELVGEMLKENGDDCIDLLIEQCKLMGLKEEDKDAIYKIIDMLKNSGMSTEDSLKQLYKFSSLVGITDKQAESHYARLVSKSKQSPKKAEDKKPGVSV